MKQSIYAIIIYLLLIINSSWAQDITGSLQGRVLNVENKPLRDVNITVSGPTLQGTRATASNDEGLFRISLLPTGVYTVKVAHIAYQMLTFEKVRIQLGKSTTLGEIVLQPKIYEADAVIVTVERPIIDPTSTTMGDNLDAHTLETLPVDRNYRNIATLLPHANAGFYDVGVNISGSTGLENVYFIDGMNVTNPENSLGGTNLPYNFIREIEIRTGGYEAEYASALGGVLNATTRSGSNEFKGQAFGFFNSDKLSAKRRLSDVEEGVEGAKNYDVGFGFGGPILPDKLWFYGAYNPTTDIEDVTLLGFGTYRDRKTSHLFAGKLSWRARENLSIGFTIVGDPSVHNIVNTEAVFAGGLANPDVVLGISKEGGVSLSLQADFYPKHNLLLQSKVSQVVQRQYYEGSTERGRSEPLFVDRETGIESGGWPNGADNERKRNEVQLSTTLFSGNHQIKAGIAYEDISDDENYRYQSVTRFNDTTFSSYSISVVGAVHNRIPSVFLQDSWRITNALNFNFGLRWDGQYMIGSNRKIAQRITDQFQPRIGVVFQPKPASLQKVFASYGRFYERLPTIFSSSFFLDTQIFNILYDHNPLLNPTEGDTLDLSAVKLDEVKGLKGQYTDEFSLGYERILFDLYKVGVRGIYRRIGEVIEDAFNLNKGYYVYGNPGRGNLSFLPQLKREYTALELTLQKFSEHTFNFMLSYVLSRNYGNYTGLLDTDYFAGQPNIIPGNDLPELLVNATGLLPNNRTHVLKFFGSYRTSVGLNIGSSFVWQSGTPLNEFGSSTLTPLYLIFLKKRGTAGNTPAIFDLSIRMTYDLKQLLGSSFHPKLILDALHVASQREALNYDQIHYFAVDENGNQIAENKDYLKPVTCQDPMTMRFGLQIDF